MTDEKKQKKIWLMRRIVTILFTVLLGAHVFAQNTLTVHQKDGEKFYFGFEDKPTVTFTDNELVVTSTKTELRYELAKVAKFTFDDIEDAVINIKADASIASITLDEYTVSITGVKADVPICLITSDGKLLQTYKTDQEGSVTFSIAELPQGAYIINSESLTCKILKK